MAECIAVLIVIHRLLTLLPNNCVIAFRMQFVFELGTSRQAGRNYQFAAESADDRQQWMMILAKVFLIADRHRSN